MYPIAAVYHKWHLAQLPSNCRPSNLFRSSGESAEQPPDPFFLCASHPSPAALASHGRWAKGKSEPQRSHSFGGLMVSNFYHSKSPADISTCQKLVSVSHGDGPCFPAGGFGASLLVSQKNTNLRKAHSNNSRPKECLYECERMLRGICPSSCCTLTPLVGKENQ